MKPMLYPLLFLLVIELALASECNVSLGIKTEKILYEGESIKYRFYLSSKIPDYEIEYWVEDLFGDIAKPKRTTKNLNQKSFTPKISGGAKPFLIKARIANISCNNLGNSTAEKLVVFKTNTTSIESNQCCSCDIKKFSYYLEHAPKIVVSDEEFLVKVRLENYDNESYDIRLWSYVYRHSKVYSKNRTENLQSLILEPNSSILVELKNKAIADPGEYKLKVKINKDNQKTDKEITSIINITSNEDFRKNTIEITSLTIVSQSQPKLITVINNTFTQAFDISLVLESLYEFQEKELAIPGKESTIVEFPVELAHEKNPFFLKLYLNNTLVDVKELILKNNENTQKKEKPFALVTGNIVFNSSHSIYKSTSQKSKELIIYLLLAVSLILNCIFVRKGKLAK